MPRPNRFPDRSPGSRRKQKQFRRGDTPRDWKKRGGEDGHRENTGPEERLQKVLASMGVGSRRDCEELIKDGRVEVDKQVVTVLGTKVDPFKHEIRVDGELLKKPERMYFAVNKPEGVVTTNFDPSGRERVIDLVPTDARLFAVGRLDRSSEGLILLTNDGEFANRLTHPRYGVEKTYLVRVAGEPGEEKLNKLRRGIHLSDGVCRVQRIVIKGRHKQSTDMIMVLNEGRNREIRRILARVGHKVLKLRRVGIGRLKLGDLPIGAWRKLAAQEIEGLLRDSRAKRDERKPEKASGGRSLQKTLPPDTKLPAETMDEAGSRGEWIVESTSPAEALPKHSVIPTGNEDDGDFEVDDFAGVSDEEMVEISGFAEDESTGDAPGGDVLDFGEEGDEGELGVEDLAEDGDEPVEESDEAPPPQRSERPAKRFEPRQTGGRRFEPRSQGKRPFKKKRFERGRRTDATGNSGGEGQERGARKFSRGGERGKFAPKGAGKGGRRFRPRGEGAATEQGGGYGSGRPRGAKFGGGPGKKFGGKPGGRTGGKPFGKPGGKFGGKKRFKPKGKGRP
jgi:23S rRNA pseudouridine2605 synthase